MGQVSETSQGLELYLKEEWPVGEGDNRSRAGLGKYQRWTWRRVSPILARYHTNYR